MFIKVTQSGQRRYAQLVESFRNEDGKPRQRTVCTLGRLEDGGEVDTLIASLQRARGIAPVASPLDGLRFTDSRHAGDVWALSELWRYCKPVQTCLQCAVPHSAARVCRSEKSGAG